MSKENVLVENSSTQSEGSDINDPKDALNQLVNLSLPQGLQATMQHVDSAMQASQKAIEESLKQSQQLIAQASTHLQQAGMAGTAQSSERGDQGALESGTSVQASSNSSSQSGLDAVTTAETHVCATLEQQNEALSQTMQHAILQVQQSVQQANEQVEEANTARQQALTHLMQGQQSQQATAPMNQHPSSQEVSHEGSTLDQQSPHTDTLPPNEQPE